MDKLTYIYVLIDPIDCKKVYIGKSDTPWKRYRSHLTPKNLMSNTYKNNWIKDLLSQDLLPIMEILELCLFSEWQLKESQWIKYYRDNTYIVMNATDGGEGGDTYSLLDNDAKIKRDKLVSQKNTGKVFSDSHKRKISLSKKGKPVHTQEYRDELSESMSGENNRFYGKHHTDETKEIIRKKNRCYEFTPEQLINISIGTRFKKHKTSSSRYFGVNRYGTKWRCRIFVCGKDIILGYFESEIDAALCYNQEIHKYFPNAPLNEV